MHRALLAIACLLALALAGCSGSGGSSDGQGTTSGGSTATSETTSGTSGTTSGADGGSTNGGSASTEAGGDSTTEAPVLTLTVVDSKLGSILADGNGHTVYLFTPDKKNKSVCTGPCPVDWPPLIADGQPALGDGVDGSLVATFKRPDGSRQVSYDGHPLYTFSGDANSGDVNGQSIGGVWFAVSPGGRQAG